MKSVHQLLKNIHFPVKYVHFEVGASNTTLCHHLFLMTVCKYLGTEVTIAQVWEYNAALALPDIEFQMPKGLGCS